MRHGRTRGRTRLVSRVAVAYRELLPRYVGITAAITTYYRAKGRQWVLYYMNDQFHTLVLGYSAWDTSVPLQDT